MCAPQETKTISEDLFFIRGLSILMVVLIHVVGVEPEQGVRGFFFPDREDLRTLAQFIHTFNMAVMLIGSGAAVSLFGHPDMSLWGFLTKKVDKLLIPMLVWAPVFLLAQHLSRGRPHNLQEWLGLLAQVPTAWFPPYTIFWFVHALLFCTFFCWLFQKVARERLGRWEGVAYLGVSVLLHLLSLEWKARAPGVAVEYLEFLLYWNRFFGVGLVVHPLLHPLRRLLVRVPRLGQLALALGMVAVLYAWFRSFPLERYEEARSLNGPLAFMLEFCLAVLLRDALKQQGEVGTWLQARVCITGSISMIIYLFHIYFLSGTRLLLAKLGGAAIALPVHLVVGCLAGLFGPVVLYNLLKPYRAFRWAVGLSRLPPLARVEPGPLKVGATQG
jgi:fucose 4-O-acetylase-like acetyltransferase